MAQDIALFSSTLDLHPKIDQSPQRFGSLRFVRLARGPSFDLCDLLVRQTKCPDGVLTGRRASHLFLLYYVLS